MEGAGLAIVEDSSWAHDLAQITAPTAVWKEQGVTARSLEAEETEEEEEVVTVIYLVEEYQCGQQSAYIYAARWQLAA